MKDFSKLVTKLRALLSKHPEIHYFMPKNPTEIDIREAAFVLRGQLKFQVITDEAITSWLDEYAFYNLGAGKDFDV